MGKKATRKHVYFPIHTQIYTCNLTSELTPTSISSSLMMRLYFFLSLKVVVMRAKVAGDSKTPTEDPTWEATAKVCLSGKTFISIHGARPKDLRVAHLPSI